MSAASDKQREADLKRRAERLASALRENLRRRKDQKRARVPGDTREQEAIVAEEPDPQVM